MLIEMHTSTMQSVRVQVVDDRGFASPTGAQNQELQGFHVVSRDVDF